MHLLGIAEYFENLADTAGIGALTGPQLVKQGVDWECERRCSPKLHRLRRQGGFTQPDTDINAMPGRAVNIELITRSPSAVIWSNTKT